MSWHKRGGQRLVRIPLLLRGVFVSELKSWLCERGFSCTGEDAGVCLGEWFESEVLQPRRAQRIKPRAAFVGGARQREHCRSKELKERVVLLADENPELTVAAISKRCNVGATTVRRILNDGDE